MPVEFAAVAGTHFPMDSLVIVPAATGRRNEGERPAGVHYPRSDIQHAIYLRMPSFVITPL